MKSHYHRPVNTVLATCIIGFTLICSGSDAAPTDRLNRAAEQLRSGQYSEALQSALTAPADPSRSLLAGKAALRLKQYDEAARQLQEAESHQLLADIALLLKAEALSGARRFREAAAAAAEASRRTPTAGIRRRADKLEADALYETGDLKEALAAYRRFTTRYTLGKDHIDALFRSAVCLESQGDGKAAAPVYRSIYLQHPTAAPAAEALERLKGLEKKGVSQAAAFNAEELFRRGQLLLTNGQPADAAWAFAAIPRTGLSDELLARIELASGQAAARQRRYSLAEPFLKRSAAAVNTTVRDEARLLLARIEIRQGKPEQALPHLLALSAERGPLADDALLESALVHKGNRRFGDAALLLQRLLREHPQSELAGRASWELAWSQYLAGDTTAADTALRKVLKIPLYRERALYWLARNQERQQRPGDAVHSYQQLLKEYPFGCYAAWYRSRSGNATGWPSLPATLPDPPLPEGSRRVQALVELGFLEEARLELGSLKSGPVSDATAPGLARLQQLAGDLHGSIVTFHQHRPATIDHSNLPFWAIGYPRRYSELFQRQIAANGLSHSLVYALTKAESSFRADIKSHAGAIGLMQLMPATARLTAGPKGKGITAQQLTDPELNIRLGTRHLKELLNQYQHDTVYTLAAYNAGAGAVGRWRKSFGDLPQDEFAENIPYQETRDYVQKIIGYQEVYRALYRLP